MFDAEVRAGLPVSARHDLGGDSGVLDGEVMPKLAAGPRGENRQPPSPVVREDAALLLRSAATGDPAGAALAAAGLVSDASVTGRPRQA